MLEFLEGVYEDRNLLIAIRMEALKVLSRISMINGGNKFHNLEYSLKQKIIENMFKGIDNIRDSLTTWEKENNKKYICNSLVSS